MHPDTALWCRSSRCRRDLHSARKIRRARFNDPVVLEKPVTYTLAYKRLPNYEMVEFVCDNNREFTDDNGVVRMKVLEK